MPNQERGTDRPFSKIETRRYLRELDATIAGALAGDSTISVVGHRDFVSERTPNAPPTVIGAPPVLGGLARLLTGS